LEDSERPSPVSPDRFSCAGRSSRNRRRGRPKWRCGNEPGGGGRVAGCRRATHHEFQATCRWPWRRRAPWWGRAGAWCASRRPRGNSSGWRRSSRIRRAVSARSRTLRPHAVLPGGAILYGGLGGQHLPGEGADPAGSGVPGRTPGGVWLRDCLAPHSGPPSGCRPRAACRRSRRTWRI